MKIIPEDKKHFANFPFAWTRIPTDTTFKNLRNFGKRKRITHINLSGRTHSHPTECSARKIPCGALSVRLPRIGQHLYAAALLVAACRARDDDRGVKYSLVFRPKKGSTRKESAEGS